jgi:hypothetical protein
VDCEPENDLLPDHAPDAVHDVMVPLDVHESVAEPLCATVHGPCELLHCISTVGAGGGLTVTVTESDMEPPGPVQVMV